MVELPMLRGVGLALLVGIVSNLCFVDIGHLFRTKYGYFTVDFPFGVAGLLACSSVCLQFLSAFEDFPLIAHGTVSVVPRGLGSNVESALQRFDRDGFVILPGVLPIGHVQRSAEIVQAELQRRHYEILWHPNRGCMRHYIPLELQGTFLEDGGVIAHPLIHAVLERILGKTYLTYELSSDTPFEGSVMQFVHGDGPRSSDGQTLVREHPMVSVNIPLVDINETNGPFEIIPGSQRRPRDVAAALVKNGSMNVLSVHLQMGDVMIRDLETLHRGTPNPSKHPRPMAVWGFASSLEVVPQHVLDQQLQLPNAMASSLSDTQKRILQLWLRK